MSTAIFLAICNFFVVNEEISNYLKTDICLFWNDKWSFGPTKPMMSKTIYRQQSGWLSLTMSLWFRRSWSSSTVFAGDGLNRREGIADSVNVVLIFSNSLSNTLFSLTIVLFLETCCCSIFCWLMSKDRCSSHTHSCGWVRKYMKGNPGIN